jgi:hypothetical protein
LEEGKTMMLHRRDIGVVLIGDSPGIASASDQCTPGPVSEGRRGEPDAVVLSAHTPVPEWLLDDLTSGARRSSGPEGAPEASPFVVVDFEHHRDAVLRLRHGERLLDLDLNSCSVSDCRVDCLVDVGADPLPVSSSNNVCRTVWPVYKTEFAGRSGSTVWSVRRADALDSGGMPSVETLSPL